MTEKIISIVMVEDYSYNDDFSMHFLTTKNCYRLDCILDTKTVTVEQNPPVRLCRNGEIELLTDVTDIWIGRETDIRNPTKTRWFLTTKAIEEPFFLEKVRNATENNS